MRPSSGNSRLLYFVTDGNGRQLMVTDSSGQLGTADVPGAPNPRGYWRFAGATASANTFNGDRQSPPNLPSVSLFRNRMYDQKSGRWTQEDPIGIAGGINLYRFSLNNPVRNSDPFGLQVEAVMQFTGWFVSRHPQTAGRIASLIEQEVQGFNCASDPYCTSVPESGTAGFLLGKAAIVAPTARFPSRGAFSAGAGSGASGVAPFPESLAGVRGTVNKVLQGDKPLSALTGQQRAAAANYYETIADQVGGRFSREARLFNLERARYLREGGEIPPGTLPKFIERLNNMIL
jgi:RHS repeat-associated protein